MKIIKFIRKLFKKEKVPKPIKRKIHCGICPHSREDNRVVYACNDCDYMREALTDSYEK